MSQTYPSISTTTPMGVTVTQHLRDRTDALRSQFSGATEPASPVSYQLWADTTRGMLCVRNAANSAWVDLAPLGYAVPQQRVVKLGGALAAGELQLAAPWPCQVVAVLLVPDTSSASSVASTTEWTFELENVTAAAALFSAVPSTATIVAGVGGGELVADAAYVLTANQNQTADANDVLRLTVAAVGSPTAIADCSIVVLLQPLGL